MSPPKNTLVAAPSPARSPKSMRRFGLAISFIAAPHPTKEATSTMPHVATAPGADIWLCKRISLPNAVSPIAAGRTATTIPTIDIGESCARAAVRLAAQSLPSSASAAFGVAVDVAEGSIIGAVAYGYRGGPRTTSFSSWDVRGATLA
ncbi:MAG: hypothetical protein ACLQBL_11200 [Polyangiaceae bacterium]